MKINMAGKIRVFLKNRYESIRQILAGFFSVSEINKYEYIRINEQCLKITVRPTARDAQLLARTNKFVCTSAQMVMVIFWGQCVYNIGIRVSRFFY